MKNLIILLLLSAFTLGCSGIKTVTNTTRKTAKTSKNDIKRDGISFKTAIVAKNVAFEYKWIRNHYPNYRVIMQSLQNNKRKYYDVLKIKNESNFERSIYFDINSFYGKGF